MQRVGEGGVWVVNVGNGRVCSPKISFALLSVFCQVAVGRVVADQTLVSRDSGAFENHQRETWMSAHVDLVGCQTRRRADRIAVCELDVRELQVPVVLSFIDNHSQHLAIVWFTHSTPPLPFG